MNDVSEKPHYVRFLSYILVIVLAVIIGVFFLSSPNGKSNSSAKQDASKSMKQYTKAPALTIDKSKKYSAVLTTTKGVMTVDLFASEAPQTVNNFIFLAKDGYYNDTVFHRIIKGFMIQGGDPRGDGTGGPGYKFDDEKITRDYKRGIIAMANSGPNTNGSQFFIMHNDYDLPKNYVIFGQVTEGLDVLDAIADTPVADNGMGETSKPKETVSIKTVQVKEM